MTRADFVTRMVASAVDFVVLGSVSLLLILVLNGGVGWLFALVAPPAYFTLTEGGPTGQTLGKRFLGIRVVSVAHGGPIGHGHALVRAVMRVPSALLCGLGYWWMLWDRDRQTWHDKVATSVVVPE